MLPICLGSQPVRRQHKRLCGVVYVDSDLSLRYVVLKFVVLCVREETVRPNRISWPCTMATAIGEGVAENKLKLYSYWRSSSSFRVRIALNYKGLKYEYKAINLLKGEQSGPEFLKLNPIGFVPSLVDGDIVVADSFAIVLYLEEKYPQHPLLPHDIKKRAINFQAASIVSSSIHPLHNLSFLKYIEEKVSPDEKLPWVKSVIGKGFTALEKLIKDHAGRYATGDEFLLADLFLAPQIHAAITRFNVDLTEFPTLARLYKTYHEIPAFLDALPENQPDAPSQAC